MLNLRFVGAARTTTGSLHSVEYDGHRDVVDCGLLQGHRKESFEANRAMPFPAESVDAICDKLDAMHGRHGDSWSHLARVILLFKDPEVNKHGAQLIFSSQDVSTMRNDVFRRDEIWFAARGEGEASQLWSLADIHEANGNLVSKNAAFDKQYLSGRYGADPYLTRIEEWD